MEPRELTNDEFSALNYLVKNKGIKIGQVEINSIAILKSSQFLDTFLKVILTPDAISYIENKDGSKSKEVCLIEKKNENNQAFYKASDFAESYVEYYQNVILTK